MEIKFKLSQVPDIVKKHILSLLRDHSIITFTGPLGAGKTTLIREILIQSGLKENITSPTFNYVNTYKGSKGCIFNHFDLFRITSLDDFLMAGFDEFFYKKNNFNLIEWPKVIDQLLQEGELKRKTVNIFLQYVDDEFDCRLIKI